MTAENVPTRRRIIILSPAPLARAPRPFKQVQALRDDYEVVTASPGNSPIEGIEHLRLPERQQRWGLLGRLAYLAALGLHLYGLVSWISAYDHAIRTAFRHREWDLVIAHDVQTAVVAEHLSPRNGVLVDLHEYAPRQNEHSAPWRLLIAPYFRWVLRGPVRRAAATVTVSRGIVDEYRREFGLDPELIVNATPFQELDSGPVRKPIRLVHSGVPAVQRRLEIMIDAVIQTTADVTLDFYLVENGSPYLEELKQRAIGSDRIRFNPPVPYADLIRTLNAYDIGLSIFAPTTFNLAWCLPNKFFDFIQARLGVIVGPSPEMEHFVEEYGVGAIMPDFEASSLADLLEQINPETVNAWKVASSTHAEELSSESQSRVLTGIVERLMRTTR